MNNINCQIIDLNDYELHNIIARGAFSVVIRATDKKTGKEVAIKAYQRVKKEEKLNDEIINGIKISILDIDGLARTIGYRPQISEEEGKLFHNIDLSGYLIVTNFYKYGDIVNFTNNYLTQKGINNVIMNPTTRSKIIFGVASTMKQLHKHNVIYHDLKNMNVFLDDNFEPKIGDFELAEFNTDQDKTLFYVGTPLYMAPELYTGDYDTYSFPVDVFSFSIFLYMMFKDKMELDSNRRLISSQIYMREISRGSRPKNDESIPPHYWELMKNCWQKEPEKRPTFEEIVEILKDDKFALEEFGMRTDLDDLHEYQKRIEEDT